MAGERKRGEILGNPEVGIFQSPIRIHGFGDYFVDTAFPSTQTSVYSARLITAADTQTPQRIVLKLIAPLSPAAAKRQHGEIPASYREHEALQRLSSIGVPVPLPKGFVDATDGNSYLMTEYFGDFDLQNLIRTNSNNMKDSQVRNMMLGIFISLAQGMAKAHQNCIINRDIKPSNIRVFKNLKAGLADWGATAIGNNYEESNSTAGYAPIEQHGSARKPHQTIDIYALGMTLYSMLGGEVPEENPVLTHAVAFKNKRFRDDISALELIDSDKRNFEAFKKINKQLADIVRKATVIDAAKRYQSVDEMLTDIYKYVRKNSPRR